MTLEKWPSADKPTVGTLVAVRFSEDGLIYRAKVAMEKGNFYQCGVLITMPGQVLSVEDSVSTVRFIDYGNTEQKTLEEMFRLGINHPLVTCLKRQAPILTGEGPWPGCASGGPRGGEHEGLCEEQGQGRCQAEQAQPRGLALHL